MIISNPLRQQTALLARTYRPSNGLRSINLHQRRYRHQVPQLTHQAHFEEHGLPPVFSPEGFDMAWTQYQGYMVNKLNLLTEGTPMAYKHPKEIALAYARDGSNASLFNHASMAHNNHHFFEALSPTPKPMPQQLAQSVAASFSSIESFRATFLATAEAMFGPGCVWLVKHNAGNLPAPRNLAILATYLAGSPYPGAHFRKQPIDVNTLTTNITGNMKPVHFAALNTLQLAAGSFGSSSAGNKQLAPGGADLEVLLAVNTWEHVWLMDHGIDGKRRYLEHWWDHVDWAVVSGRANWDIGPQITKYQKQVVRIDMGRMSQRL